MEIYDFAGIGFGPANLSVAVAMEEQGLLSGGLNVTFLDSKPEFVWHGDMLLPEAEMQISFFKDLVMLRNPSSPFTFLNYLAKQNRLEEFANLKRFFPRRVEFNDYLKWAASHFADYVAYNERVFSIEPYSESGAPVKLIAINKECTRTGKKSVTYARNISLATGLTKKFPAGLDIQPGNRVFHSGDFLKSLKSHYRDASAPFRFVVVGSGQSAAEITLHLAEQFPNSTVTMCFRGFAIKPSDETEFVNEIFDGQSAEEFQKYSPGLKQQVLDSHRDTNYSVVDPELISALYDRLYTQKVTGRQQVRLNHFYELTGVDQNQQRATFRDHKRRQSTDLAFDGMFLATGYEPKSTELLRGFEKHLEFEAPATLAVDENYSVKVKPGAHFLPRIFLQGASERSHGLSETLLSLLAYRSSKIAGQLSVNQNRMAV